jgi:hypothetical protein
MSHFAKVLDGKVIQVIVAEVDFFNNFVDTSPGEWIQTSYNTFNNQHRLGGTPLRGNFAGIGYTYDKTNDVFYPPQPFPSWSLDESIWNWLPPVPYPDDEKKYWWVESTKNWVEIE